MSYFYKNKVYDTYEINSTIYANDGDIILNDYIEIFNNEEIVLDFSNTNMICSNEKVKGSELHKIKIQWGDGTEDVVVKDIVDKGQAIKTISPSWRRISHLYNTDKRNVYLTEDVASLPEIVIHFYNTYNDVIRLVIPYKLVYKTIYDLNCRFNLMSANTGNDYLTTFVVKEGVGDSLSVIHSVNPMLGVVYDNDIVYIKDKTVSVDYSEEYVDEDNVMWAWDQIPYVTIDTTFNEYQYDDGNTYRGLLCDCTERTVPVETWTPRVEKILDEGNKTIENVKNNEDGLFMFHVFGGTESEPADLETGLYKIDLYVTGINDVEGYTDKKLVPIPTDSNFITNVKYGTFEEDATIPNRYCFTIQKGEHEQWSYLKSAKLVFKPTYIDTSNDGLNIDSTTWSVADESFRFEFNLDLNKDVKDGIVPIYKKALPNGKYKIWCIAEDLLGNYTDEKTLLKDSSNVKEITWSYGSIGDIESKVYQADEVTETHIKHNGEDKGLFVGDITGLSSSYTCDKIKVDSDAHVFSWIISNPSEMDKVQFKLEYYQNETNTWDVIFNEKKMHNQWTGEQLLKVDNVFGNKILSEDTTESPDKYRYKFNFPHINYDDGKYKATMSHIIDMTDFAKERIKTVSEEITLGYDVPKVTVNSIHPVFKFNKSLKRWQPYIQVSTSCTKNDISDFTMYLDYGNDIVYSETTMMSGLVERNANDFFKDYDSVNVSFTCRDAKDVIHRRVEENPTPTQFTRITRDFLKCHTSIPDYDDITDTFKNYKDNYGNIISGAELQIQTSVDVYKTHYCKKGDKTYFKYVENGVEPNYFGTDKSYFMTKEYTPLIYEGDKVSEDTPKKTTRFIQADEFDITSGWKELQSMSDQFNGEIPMTATYDNTIDKMTLVIKDTTAEQPHEILYSKLQLFKDGSLTRSLPMNNIKNGEPITGVELGNYRIDFEYSSIKTNNSLPILLSENVKLLADKDKVLDDVRATTSRTNNVIGNNSYVDSTTGETVTEKLYGYFVTFEWKLKHKFASNLTLVIQSENKTEVFDNALQYESYTPQTLFTKGEKITYYFRMTSNLVDFGSDLNVGEVFRKEITV